MKRCPTCNRTFDEDWLAFCTQDGTTLIEDGAAKSSERSNEPPPTILAPPPAPPPGDWQQPSGGLGSGNFQSQPFPPAPPPSAGSPSGGFGSGQFQPAGQQMSGWQPPPPPTIQGPKQGIAVASMICGIFSVTIGWCCYLGVLSAPTAIGLGIYQLSQIKKDPEHNTGKPFALTGIIAGAAYFVGLAIFILLYGAALLMGGLGK